MTDGHVQAINEAIEIEVRGAKDPGGYTNDPKDPGGETRWGVTKKALLASKWAAYANDMKNLPREIAFEFMYHKYALAPHFNLILDVAPQVGNELIEAGINLGPDRPSRWLQRTLNVMNVSGHLYADIGVDGDVGTKTRDALVAYMKTRDAGVITLQLNHMQGAEYMRLAESNMNFERFFYGWVRNRTKVVDLPHAQRMVASGAH